jgi:hypothetical protein
MFMHLEEVYRELEKHQGKFFTLYDGRLLVTDDEQKIFDKVGSKCIVKQVPLLKGHFVWRAQISQFIDELSQAPSPAMIEPDMQIRTDDEMDVQDESENGTLFSKLRRLFGK